MRGNRDRKTVQLVAPIVAGRVPPHDLDSEAAVLSAILLGGVAALAIALTVLRPEMFYSDSNGKVFEAASELGATNKPVDIITVCAWLREREKLQAVGGPSYIAQLADATPAVANLDAHCEIIVNAHRRRLLIATCQVVAAEGYGDVGQVEGWIDDAASRLAKVTGERAGETLTGAPALTRAWSERMNRQTTGVEDVGLSIGFIDLKNYALLLGNVTIIAGRPGMAKSSIALQLLLQICETPPPIGADGKPLEPWSAAVFFSLEMPKEQVVNRILCNRSGVDIGRALKRELNPNEMNEMMRAAVDFERLAFWVDDQPAISLVQLRAKTRIAASRARAEGAELRAIAVDYLQLMSGSGRADNREQEIADISRGLKQLAKEERIHIFGLSQLNRKVEERKPPRPQLSDLRESGAIEQDADGVLLLYRADYYADRAKPDPEDVGVCEVIVGKQRDGASGWTGRLRFFDQSASFGNLARG